jgi:hypothetical protein
VYVCHQIDCGAQVIQLFDSWAHHLSPQQYMEFSHPYSERVIATVKAKYPDTPLIFHANGGVGKLDIMKESAADVIGLDWNTNMAEARAVFGPDRVLQAGLWAYHRPLHFIKPELSCFFHLLHLFDLKVLPVPPLKRDHANDLNLSLKL